MILSVTELLLKKKKIYSSHTKIRPKKEKRKTQNELLVTVQHTSLMFVYSPFGS